MWGSSKALRRINFGRTDGLETLRELQSCLAEALRGPMQTLGTERRELLATTRIYSPPHHPPTTNIGGNSQLRTPTTYITTYTFFFNTHFLGIPGQLSPEASSATERQPLLSGGPTNLRGNPLPLQESTLGVHPRATWEADLLISTRTIAEQLFLPAQWPVHAGRSRVLKRPETIPHGRLTGGRCIHCAVRKRGQWASSVTASWWLANGTVAHWRWLAPGPAVILMLLYCVSLVHWQLLPSAT